MPIPLHAVPAEPSRRAISITQTILVEYWVKGNATSYMQTLQSHLDVQLVQQTILVEYWVKGNTTSYISSLQKNFIRIS